MRKFRIVCLESEGPRVSEFQFFFFFVWYSSGTSTLVIILCSLRTIVNHCLLGVGKVLFF